jgi:hypothetical protein
MGYAKPQGCDVQSAALIICVLSALDGGFTLD